MANRSRVAAFGEVMMRLQVPGYELMSQADSLRYSFSGTGVNVGSALARFGHDSSLISRLPDNALGEAATANLRKLGLSLEHVSRGGNYLGMYFLENGFGARPGRVTYSNRQESSFNTAPPNAYDYDTIAARIELVHFCGITLAMNDNVRQHMFQLAKAVKRNGGTVVFDCNYRPTHWGDGGYAKAKPHYEQMLELADIVMMNERDMIHILGMSTDKTDRMEQLTELLPVIAQRFAGISVIAGTHRSINRDNSHSLRGFIYKYGALTIAPEPLTFAVYDRIGAGDAFASGIIHGELSAFEPERTVRFATAAAMLAHTVAGDTPMSTVREIERAMTDLANGDVIR
ncbi:sugar kinase [Paenibacillus sp. CF384]|uniref:sugar kinase n=1 Tax=Paenibacillus sp. CF384 TaxID=1884382 RepID=UPI00089953AD|nr:sugar kinase [Paenibacillus sp. CF384]SDW46685.1 2-dehydro-3-deoxygluconokinase [Paenibacillus sp. CF384]